MAWGFDGLAAPAGGLADLGAEGEVSREVRCAGVSPGEEIVPFYTLGQSRKRMLRCLG